MGGYDRNAWVVIAEIRNRYLHSLLREIGEEFNDTVITEVKVGEDVNELSFVIPNNVIRLGG